MRARAPSHRPPTRLGTRRALLAAAGALALACSSRAPDPEQAEVAQQRELRQQAVAELAPRPLAAAPEPVTTTATAPDPATAASVAAASLPLLGEEGVDAFGLPTRHVDRGALRALLKRQRFAELTRVVESLQEAFEEDRSRERWVEDASDALGTAEKELLPSLDAWVAAAPRSFAPFLARGTHWVNAAFARRGSAWAKDTADADFDAMRDALARALPDLKRALELRPGLVAAMTKLLRANQLLPGGRRQNAAIAAVAVRACPSCFVVDMTYLATLIPRWGGTYPAMKAYVRRRSPGNPRRAILLGTIDVDKAFTPGLEGRHREALALLDRAIARAEYWSFLVERASLELRMSDVPRALADLDRAAQLRPGHPEVLFARALAFGMAKRPEEAGRELRAGIEVDPAHWRVRGGHDNLLAGVVSGLMVAGWERFRAGDREGAIRDYDLALELDPENREAHGRRATIIAGGKTEPAALTARLEEAQQDVPDDFRAVQQLDYQLARQGRFGPVVGLWSKFLARHPDHGPAYLERGGAYFHLGRRAEALADARRACDLGVSEGCVRARQLGGAR